MVIVGVLEQQYKFYTILDVYSSGTAKRLVLGDNFMLYCGLGIDSANASQLALIGQLTNNNYIVLGMINISGFYTDKCRGRDTTQNIDIRPIVFNQPFKSNTQKLYKQPIIFKTIDGLEEESEGMPATINNIWNVSFHNGGTKILKTDEYFISNNDMYFNWNGGRVQILETALLCEFLGGEKMNNNATIWIKRIIPIISGTITTILGGWDMLLKTLVGLVVTDYVVGVIAAGINREINSNIGFKGIFRKVILFVPVGVAYALDQVLGSEVLRNMAIWFYIGNEGISIVENLGKAGIPIPVFIKETLIQLKNENNKGGV